MPEKLRILAQDSGRLSFRAATRWIAGAIAALGSVSVVGALSSMPSRPDEQHKVVEALNIRPPPAAVDTNLPFVRAEVVKPGDSLRSLTHRRGVQNPANLEEVLGSIKTHPGVGPLRSGLPATAVMASSGELLTLALPIGNGMERLRVERRGEDYVLSREGLVAPTGLEMRGGIVSSSLFAATGCGGRA